MSDSATTERPAEKRDRSHYLYMAVIAAVIAGIAVGILAPEVGKALKPLGTGFVSLIKMMISPVIFCTIVLGIGSIRQAAKVGKVGGLALLYFIVKRVLSGEDPFDEATMIDDEEPPELAEHPLARHEVSAARPPSN